MSIWKDEFALTLCHFNHAAIAPWPKRSVEAVKSFASANYHRGSHAYLQWLEKEQQLRQRLQTLINAPSVDDIALLKSTSEGLSVIAQGIDWQAGDNVVLFQGEFPSNRIVWQNLEQSGVDVRLVNPEADQSLESALKAAVDENTRLLAVSAVQYASGYRVDLQDLGHFCRQNAVLFCVDAIQHLGLIPFDAQACHADFVVADGHKWLFGPEGLAVFYVRAELREQLILRQHGWHMLEHAGDYDRLDWQPAKTAKRFECGSPNLLGSFALEASLSLLQEIGIERVYQHTLANVDKLKAALPQWNLHAQPAGDLASGIVTFKHQDPAFDHQALYQRLMENEVLCAYRGGGLRLAPGFHTDEAQFEYLFTTLDKTLERTC